MFGPNPNSSRFVLCGLGRIDPLSHIPKASGMEKLEVNACSLSKPL